MKKRKFNEVYGIEVKINLSLLEEDVRKRMLSDSGFPNCCVCGYYYVQNNILTFYMWRPCENTWTMEEQMRRYGFRYQPGSQYREVRTRGEYKDDVRLSDYIPNFREWWAKNSWWFEDNDISVNVKNEEKPSDYEYEEDEMGRYSRYTRSRSTIYDRVPTIATMY